MMFPRKRRDWALKENAVTPESVHADRRRLLKAMGLGAAVLAVPGLYRLASSETAARMLGTAPARAASRPRADLYPVERNAAFEGGRPLSAEADVVSYNNYYEFGSHKGIADAAQALPLRPWAVTIDGLVEKPLTLDADDLIRRMPLEERVYRHRCVEAWAMTVPWSGFPLKALVDLARPLSGAGYIRFETFSNPNVAGGQGQYWYPWPYVEGLTIAEATNELAFVATGLYGKPLPKQNGAPLRLVTPWKYGFKSTKAPVRISFTAERPVGFWERVQAEEYGFWANVNPEVAHPRWSQASERLLGSGERVPTRLFNGYAREVAHLYKGLEGERLYT